MDGSIENTDWTTVSSYPPIAEYAFLSDCEVTALVAPSGNVEWMCLPRMDGPSIFGAILDRDAGGFRLRAGRRPRARGAAVPARDDDPRDQLGHPDRLGHRPRLPAHRAVAPREPSGPTRYRRAPTDYDTEHVLLREVRCVNGEVQMSLDCSPMFDYGRSRRSGPTTATGLPRRDHRDQRSDLGLRADDRHAARLRGDPGHRAHA